MGTCFQMEHRSTETSQSDPAMVGFDNPAHVGFGMTSLDLEPDQRSVTSESTSGIASGKHDSDDEDNDNYFKDSVP